MSKTIAAISTPSGDGGIGVIRISGDDAISVADKVFMATSGKKLDSMKGYTAAYGTVFKDGEPLDKAVALLFRAPHSYTGENTVELSVHGGHFVTAECLEAVLSAGAEPADRGEFTKRAYLNGKLDMIEAEAVMNIISAEGKSALKASLAAHDGALSRKIGEIKDILLHAAAVIAAFSDYPDEDESFSGIDELGNLMQSAKDKLDKLISTYNTGKILKDGVRTAIVGSPNVGKSTLMNLLSGSERSIVTSVAGTTRDVIEETVLIGDIKLILADTAGIRATEDIVEQIGVKQAKNRLETADLILAVFDCSKQLSSDDRELLSELKNQTSLIILNKSDLENALNEAEFSRFSPNVVHISAKEETGLDELKEKILSLVGLSNFDPSAALIFNQRQKNCVKTAAERLSEAISVLNQGYTYDAVGVCLDDALSALLELTGERVTVSVTNEVFSRFCVGK